MRRIVFLLLLASATLYAQTNMAEIRKQVVETALGLKGVPYVYGAESPPDALDCSGFVQYVYRKAAGLEIPRNSRQQWASGYPIKMTEIRPGDVFVFDTSGSGPSHVALYIGNGSMIQAASEGPQTGVIVSSLSERYWASRLLGARSFLDHPSGAEGGAASQAPAPAAAPSAAQAVPKAATVPAAPSVTSSTPAPGQAAASPATATPAAPSVTTGPPAPAPAATATPAAPSVTTATPAPAPAATAAPAAPVRAAAAVAPAPAATAAPPTPVPAAAVVTSPPPATAPASSPGDSIPVSEIGFTLGTTASVVTDRIPAAVGSMLAFTINNGTGRSGQFQVDFYRASADFSQNVSLRHLVVTIADGAGYRLDPFLFDEPGRYRLNVKTAGNIQLMQRTFEVVQVGKGGAIQAYSGTRAPTVAIAKGTPLTKVGLIVGAASPDQGSPLTAALASALVLRVANGTGVDRDFEFLLYRMATGGGENLILDDERARLPKGGWIELKPVLLSEPGIYRFVAKSSENDLLLQRTIVVESGK
ncbi:MAG TPA: C40 family peptidase [Rectinemataceae bacterium]|nr:C40 family peptidase [Rectinemataceae bacterium]